MTDNSSLGRVGVVGAGTMGAGIAQLAVTGGMDAMLYDPDPKALFGGVDRAVGSIERGVEQGRQTAEASVAAIGRLRPAPRLDDLAGCELVIEAAPEELELKRELFGRLERACGPEAVLASNTSSLSVTAIAEGTERPERVVGMHFFNPPPAMKLVEVVAGARSGEPALAAVEGLAEAMGRTPIRARDSVGFVANRCARPYSLEALRMLAEEVADHEQIDRICRLGGGFRMGPFELIDLIGVDVNLAVASSFYERSGGEPRWRPSELQRAMVVEGRLGRKSGRGFYEYTSGERREPDPEVDAELPLFERAELEAVAGPLAPQVLGRIAAQIANEAAFALADRVASPADIDTAMRLGFNWPAGPLEFAERLGPDRAVALLDELR
ncbi:MAG: 3-hydroxybutyryl-CoA dehydrogenase, partial [Actinobacteria bacterium]|nr:3-hydroxybutyryl-CoA dehydrogenase [Actinomycetota bacterium]